MIRCQSPKLGMWQNNAEHAENAENRRAFLEKNDHWSILTSLSANLCVLGDLSIKK
jgi:hypothetical protein